MTSTVTETLTPTRSETPADRLPVLRHRVFLTATAAVMLHVADDNFVQPQPGTSAADHLVSGLVPLAALAVIAAAYLRVRSGARAVLAIAVGLFGIVVGLVEAGYYATTVGPSGDDYTGFLAGAGGIVLLGLAAVTLWRSRKPGPTRVRRYLRRGLLGLLGVGLISELFVPFGFAYLTTHVHTAEVPVADLRTTYENVTLTTSDGIDLAAWYVPSRNGAAIVIPGRTKSQGHARMLIEHGYGVLLYDRRGEGASEGDPSLYGWGGSRDVHAAVDYLETRPDVDPGRIGGLGLSVGGEMLLQVAAESTDLAAVVSDGAGTRTISEEFEDFTGGLQARVFAGMLVKHAGLLLFSSAPAPESLLDLVPRIAPRPVLLIWAPNGDNREGLNPTYQRLIGSSAEIWGLPDIEHVKAFRDHPEEYERRVVAFFDAALLTRGRAAPPR